MADDSIVRRDDEMFSDMVRTLASGALDDEATAQLRELVKEMHRIATMTGGKPKGTLTLKIAFNLDGGVMDVVPTLSVNRPTPLRARSIMYPQRDGSLSREDTRQGQLFRGEVRDGIPGAPR